MLALSRNKCAQICLVSPLVVDSPQIHNIQQQAAQHTTIHTKSNKCVSKMLTRHTGTAKCVICAAFWSFFLWLNCKIRVTRLLVTVRAFCLIHTALKCTKTYYFGAKKIFGSTLHPYWRLRRLTPVNIWILTPKKHFLLISDITEMHQKR